jgi:hypothetical protein
MHRQEKFTDQTVQRLKDSFTGYHHPLDFGGQCNFVAEYIHFGEGMNLPLIEELWEIGGLSEYIQIDGERILSYPKELDRQGLLVDSQSYQTRLLRFLKLTVGTTYLLERDLEYEPALRLVKTLGSIKDFEGFSANAFFSMTIHSYLDNLLKKMNGSEFFSAEQLEYRQTFEALSEHFYENVINNINHVYAIIKSEVTSSHHFSVQGLIYSLISASSQIRIERHPSYPDGDDVINMTYGEILESIKVRLSPKGWAIFLDNIGNLIPCEIVQ